MKWLLIIIFTADNPVALQMDTFETGEACRAMSLTLRTNPSDRVIGVYCTGLDGIPGHILVGEKVPVQLQFLRKALSTIN